MNPIKKLAIDFIESHWDEIDLKKVEITDFKQKFINKIVKQDDLAWWVVIEVMNWGCKKNYLEEHIVSREYGSYCVIKIDDRYFQPTETFHYKEVFPKTKTVIYFE